MLGELSINRAMLGNPIRPTDSVICNRHNRANATTASRRPVSRTRIRRDTLAASRQ